MYIRKPHLVYYALIIITQKIRFVQYFLIFIDKFFNIFHIVLKKRLEIGLEKNTNI